MTIVNAPIFPYTVAPIANIAPFTYQDGLTFAEVFANFRDYITNTLVPYIESYATSDINAYNAATTALNTAMDNWNTNASADISSINNVLTEVNTALANATTQATNAANSATNAQASATSAATSATNAAASATASANSATNSEQNAIAIAKAANHYIVTQNGAVGDGVTDDTSAIQSLINSVPAGSVIEFTPGKSFVLSTTLTVGKPLVFVGNGVLNWTSGIASAAAIEATADGLVFRGLSLHNVNKLFSQTGNKNTGIYIHGNNAIVENCFIEYFLEGIAIAADGEWSNTVITGNRIKDTIGAGDGATNTTSTYGEDRGDGIVVWGCQATITNNVVNALAGTDARIGVSVEALPTYETGQPAVHPDAMFTIANNVVYGQFRRSIAAEGVSYAVIANNSVADATWWGINLGQTSRYCTIIGNAIYWTRTANDNQGQSWSPSRAIIMAYAPGIGNVIANNTIEVASSGVADAGIELFGINSTTYHQDSIVSGNVVTAFNGASVTEGIVVVNYCQNITITDNKIDGKFTGHGITSYESGDLNVCNNTIALATNTVPGIQLNNATSDCSVNGNIINNASVGITVPSVANIMICNNKIKNSTTAIDAFGNTNTMIANNMFMTCPTGVANGNSAGSVTNNYAV